MPWSVYKSQQVEGNGEPRVEKPFTKYRFDRMEIAGSLGDLGTLLPLAIGMIVLCGLHATNVIMMAGLFYILAGTYFRVPIAVQPMKTIAAYALGMELLPTQIVSTGLWMGVILLILGVTGLIEIIRKYTPLSTIRGVQLAVGMVLLIKGLELMVDGDPSLNIHSLGPIPMGIVLGVIGMVLTFAFLDNKRFPAALIVVGFGILIGLLIGKPIQLPETSVGLHLPAPLPYGFPPWSDLLFVLPIAVLPQLPMTVGNAIISNTDVAHRYFGKQAVRVTNRSSSISQGIANICSFVFGGMPMCHGAGGLAAHYRFGARTGGSNLIIGIALLVLALVFGENIVPVLNLLPRSILGVLLVFAGIQLALMIQDLEKKKDFFVALAILGLALAFDLGTAFLAGIVLAYALRSDKIRI
ncbi:MAG: sulfate permease [Proteobacteria bacterium]|nr:sulfate permease [Pseudomonadota bacterium]